MPMVDGLKAGGDQQNTRQIQTTQLQMRPHRISSARTLYERAQPVVVVQRMVAVRRQLIRLTRAERDVVTAMTVTRPVSKRRQR